MVKQVTNIIIFINRRLWYLCLNNRKVLKNKDLEYILEYIHVVTLKKVVVKD